MIRCNRKAVKNFDSMKVKDLLKALERVDPEAEVIEEFAAEDYKTSN